MMPLLRYHSLAMPLSNSPPLSDLMNRTLEKSSIITNRWSLPVSDGVNGPVMSTCINSAFLFPLGLCLFLGLHVALYCWQTSQSASEKGSFVTSRGLHPVRSPLFAKSSSLLRPMCPNLLCSSPSLDRALAVPACRNAIRPAGAVDVASHCARHRPPCLERVSDAWPFLICPPSAVSLTFHPPFTILSVDSRLTLDPGT